MTTPSIALLTVSAQIVNAQARRVQVATPVHASA